MAKHVKSAFPRSDFAARIDVERFRSIVEASIPLAPLTVLVGSNGSGKSNIIRAIYECCRLSQLLLEERRHEMIPRTIGWSEELGKPCLVPFDDRDAREASRSGRMAANHLEPFNLSRYSQDRDLLLRLSFAPLDDYCGHSAEFYYTPEADDPAIEWSARNDLLQPDAPDPTQPADSQGTTLTFTTSPAPAGWVGILKAAADMVYLSEDRVLRAQQARQQPAAGSPPPRPGLQDYPDGTIDTLLADPFDLTEVLSIGRELFDVDWEPLLASHPGRKEFVDAVNSRPTGRLPISLASLGNRQALPILLHLAYFASKRTGVLLTEEPEISLHPRAQVEVGEYIARCVHDGAQVIFSTHSHYMLLGISKAVRRRVLYSEDVAVLNCSKSANGTQVKLLPMDDFGRIDGGIPSFAAIDDYIFENWIADLPRDN